MSCALYVCTYIEYMYSSCMCSKGRQGMTIRDGFDSKFATYHDSHTNHFSESGHPSLQPAIGLGLLLLRTTDIQYPVRRIRSANR